METRELIALTLLKGQGIGNSFIKNNLGALKSAPSILDYIQKSKPEFDTDAFIEEGLPKAERIIQECKEKQYTIATIASAEYPAPLRELSDPPAVIYMRGDVTLVNKVVAIIGTRKSTVLGNRIAEKLGAYFSRTHSICNGLVEGIDKHSIYSNGKILPNVVGVISGGLNYDQTCSKASAAIIDDVLSAGGLIISEFPPYQKEDRFSGSKVSRIQAGLAEALILVQSSLTGGSKYTLKAYSKLNRPLGVIHFPAHEEYKSDVFGANRAIIEKGLEGVAEFIGLKSSGGLRFSKIIKLESQADYTNLTSIEEETTSLF